MNNLSVNLLVYYDLWCDVVTCIFGIPKILYRVFVGAMVLLSVCVCDCVLWKIDDIGDGDLYMELGSRKKASH